MKERVQDKEKETPGKVWEGGQELKKWERIDQGGGYGYDSNSIS